MSSSSETPQLKDLIRELLAMSKKSFPMKCPVCAREYLYYEQFAKQTDPDKPGADDKASVVEGKAVRLVGIHRTCRCGQRLSVVFPNRRDHSEAGARRRDTFAQVVDMLRASGLSAEDARLEVLRLMEKRPK